MSGLGVKDFVNGQYPLNKSENYHLKRYREVKNGSPFFKKLLNNFELLGINIVNNDNVLDMGCGYGYDLFSLSRTFNRVISYDINLDRVLSAKKLSVQNSLNNVSLLVADTKYLPFKEETFDFINASSSIEYVIHEPEDGIDEGFRVLKKGGAFYFSMSNRWSIQKDAGCGKRLICYSRNSVNKLRPLTALLGYFGIRRRVKQFSKYYVKRKNIDLSKQSIKRIVGMELLITLFNPGFRVFCKK